MYQAPALQSFAEHKKQNAQFGHTIDFSNFNLPSRDQFSAFRSFYQGVVDVSLVSGDAQSFPARQMVWNLDELAFMRTRFPGEKHACRHEHLKKCALDHWYISLPFYFPTSGNSHGGASALPELHCLAAPFGTEIDPDGMLTLFIPHDFTPTLGLHRMLDVRVDGGLGRLLADYLFLLDRSLSELQSAEIPYIVEATRSLVAACVAPSQDRLAEAQAPIDATLLGRARRIIGGKLADPDLCSETLCVALGASRSRLYRLFEPFGGVASYVRKQRLLRTRDALSDVEDGRPISRIAEQWGFIDASAFSRTFRHEFGISPKEARDIGWASNGLVVAREHRGRSDSPHTLCQLLRTLGSN